MCGHRYKKEGPQDERMERLRFYNHLRTYLVVNALLLFFSLKNGGNFHFMYVTFFWGIGLLSHYSKVFGNRWMDQDRHRFDYEAEDDEIIEPLEEKRKDPRWKNRDLV